MKRQQITKITCFIILLTVSYFPSFSQALTKGSVFANISAGFVKPITPEYFQNNQPLMLNGKVGWFLKARLSLEVEANITNYSDNVIRLHNETDPIGSLRTKANQKDKSFSIGLSLGKYISLNKRLFLKGNLYAHYLHNIWKEDGFYTTAEGEPLDETSYGLEQFRNYFGRAGLNTEIHYFFKQNLAGTLRLAQVDFRFQKGGRQKGYLEAPILLGISYHFKL